MLPADVQIIAPGTDRPRSRVRWSGLWRGWACAAQACDVKVAVERVDADGATVAYDFKRGQNGHFVASRPDLWGAEVDGYLEALRLR